MFKAPVYERLLGLENKFGGRFFMPGHKGGGPFEEENFLNPVMPFDVTETPVTGDLYGDGDIFDEANRLLASAYGAKQSFMMCGGATQGIYTAMFLASGRGKKFLIDRNCHRSVYSAMALLDIAPVYIVPDVIYPFGVSAPLDAGAVCEMLKNNPDICAFVLTSPTYYGVVSDVLKIQRTCARFGVALIVDEAHGAHFAFSNKLPQSAASISDYAVSSAHKTLPALTGGAYLHVNADIQREEILEALKMFGSSSPSYLISASLDWARGYMSEYGEKRLEDLIDACDAVRKKLFTLGICCLDSKSLSGLGITVDPTRIVLTPKAGDAGRIYRELITRKIIPELCDGTNILLLPSVWTKNLEFNNFLGAVSDIIDKGRTDNGSFQVFTQGGETPPEMILTPHRAAFKGKERLPLSEAALRISASLLGPYPPGVAVVAPGELLTKKTIERLKNTFDTIYVVEKERI